MLMLVRRASSRLLREERGLTLIELLVSMTAGVVVVAGATLVLVVALRQNTRVIDAVQADSIGRTALNQIVDELHSSCTGFGSTSIQAPSTTPTTLVSTGPLSLWFLTAYGNGTSGEAVIKRVTLHDIAWSSTGTSNTKQPLGKLIDYSWTGSGEPPNTPWTFNSVLSPTTANATRVIATNVIPAKEPSPEHVFSYERYDTTPADKTFGELVPLVSSELPPTVTTAKRIASVKIEYTQAPERGDTRAGHTAKFSDSVVLRLTPPESNSEGSTCA